MNDEIGNVKEYRKNTYGCGEEYTDVRQSIKGGTVDRRNPPTVSNRTDQDAPASGVLSFSFAALLRACVVDSGLSDAL